MKILNEEEFGFTDLMKSRVFEWPCSMEKGLGCREKWIRTKINLDEATFVRIPRYFDYDNRVETLWFQNLLNASSTRFALFPNENLAKEFAELDRNLLRSRWFTVEKGIPYFQWSVWLLEWEVDDAKLTINNLIAQSGIRFNPSTIGSDSAALTTAKIWADWCLEYLSELPSVVRDCHTDQMDNNLAWINLIQNGGLSSSGFEFEFEFERR